jgi:carboxymethylenebutenolidase
MSLFRMIGRFFIVLLAAVLFPSSALRAERQEVEVPVVSRSISGSLFIPSAPLPAPAILVLPTRGGLDSADISYAADLAEAGFVSLAVNYLNPQWAELLHHGGYTKDLSLVVNYLRARPEVQGKPVGIVGFSLGAPHGIRVAAQNPGVKVVVGYYGPYAYAFALPLRAKSDPSFAAIDVAAILNVPLLLFHGEADDEAPINWAYGMRDALLKAGKTVELVVYPKAHHRFDRGPVPGMRGPRSKHGYTYILDEKAKEDAWSKTLSWFRKYLSGGQ